MPYVTVRQTPRTHQLTLLDILFHREDEIRRYTTCSESDTVTRIIDIPGERYIRNATDALITILERFAEVHADLYIPERSELYHSYKIPKRSGGFRPIDEPLPPLMNALRELKSIFESDFGALYHTAAFAYVKKRSTLDAVKRHQTNGSRWFLKTDFSNFFGNTTKPFVMSMLAQIFPFSEVCASDRGREALDKAIDLAFFKGGLPQGTPISPTITNLVMIPFDHLVYNAFRKQHFVYTRYADDILVSSKYDFDWQAIVAELEKALKQFDAPFTIKPEKTRYGSSSGRNWNLGLMLTKDNRITVGRKKKEQLKAMVCNYIKDRQSGKSWDVGDVRYMSGLISYYRMVEPEYIDSFYSYIDGKFHVSLKAMIKEDLS